MATAARDIGNTFQVPAGPLEPIPVIADGGGEVRVIVVDFPAPPSVGDRFTFGGITWEVVHPEDHARGCVARPYAGDLQPNATAAS